MNFLSALSIFFYFRQSMNLKKEKKNIGSEKFGKFLVYVQFLVFLGSLMDHVQWIRVKCRLIYKLWLFLVKDDDEKKERGEEKIPLPPNPTSPDDRNCGTKSETYVGGTMNDLMSLFQW